MEPPSYPIDTASGDFLLKSLPLLSIDEEERLPQVAKIADYSELFRSLVKSNSANRCPPRCRVEELAGRVETAEGPSHLPRRDLLEIFMICRPPSVFQSSKAWADARAQFMRFWNEGAEESAAIRLMDANWFWRVGHDGDGLTPLFVAEVMDSECNTCTATGETASNALTAAALRTHARLIGKPDQVVALR